MEEKQEPLVDTHNARITFGRHANELITRLPPSYLKWLVANKVNKAVRLRDGTEVPIYVAAGSEIVRRGERIEDSDVSAHAIDRISQQLLKTWKANRNKDEGIYTWAQRMTLEAYNWSGKNPDKCERQQKKDEEILIVPFVDLRWVIQTNLLIPVLKTVTKIPIKRSKVPTKPKLHKRKNRKAKGKKRKDGQ